MPLNSKKFAPKFGTKTNHSIRFTPRLNSSRSSLYILKRCLIAEWRKNSTLKFRRAREGVFKKEIRQEADVEKAGIGTLWLPALLSYEYELNRPGVVLPFSFFFVSNSRVPMKIQTLFISWDKL